MSIEAMKLVRDAIEQGIDLKLIGAKHILDQAIEQAPQSEARGLSQKQEPVAWRNAALRVGEDLCSVGPFGYYDMTAEQWLDWALSVVTVHAPPPQRQPLTDKGVDKAILDYELALAELVDKITNGRDSGNLLNDAITASKMLDQRQPLTDEQIAKAKEEERQVCANELMAFANRHRNLHSAGMTDLDHCVVYTLETNAYLLRTRFYENHAPKEAAHGIKGEA